MRGPFKFKGSNRFYNVYRTNKYETYIRIFYLPDTTERTLVNDFQNGVDMSTFLQNGNMMVKVFHQYMIFNQKGTFVNKVGVEPYENLVLASHSGNIITFEKFHQLHIDLEKEIREAGTGETKRYVFHDFEEQVYNP